MNNDDWWLQRKEIFFNSGGRQIWMSHLFSLTFQMTLGPLKLAWLKPVEKATGETRETTRMTKTLFSECTHADSSVLFSSWSSQNRLALTALMTRPRFHKEAASFTCPRHTRRRSRRDLSRAHDNVGVWDASALTGTLIGTRGRRHVGLCVS